MKNLVIATKQSIGFGPKAQPAFDRDVVIENIKRMSKGEPLTSKEFTEIMAAASTDIGVTHIIQDSGDTIRDQYDISTLKDELAQLA